MTLPTTKEQAAFEQFTPVLVQILSQLSEAQRNQVFNYAVSLYNREVEK